MEIFTQTNVAKIDELKLDFEQRIDELQNTLEKNEISRQELDRELRKLKK